MRTTGKIKISKELTETSMYLDKEEVKTWFAETIYEGSILIELVIDQIKEEVLFITSCSPEPSHNYQYRFRKAIFHTIQQVQLGSYLHKFFTHDVAQERIEYKCRRESGTYVVESIQIKKYPSYFTMLLRFGDSDSSLTFSFLTCATQERFGVYQQKKGKVQILDLLTKQEITFSNPFEKEK